MKFIFTTVFSILSLAVLAQAQVSPATKASGSIGGKALTIKYGAPSVRGRQVFAPDGQISGDPNYPIWRAGADAATAFHTEADLDINGLSVPKGDYTFYVLLQDPNAWQLVISKQTGQWGLSYDQAQDLGRVKMSMSKPGALVEQLKYTITSTGPKTGKIQLAWEQHIGAVTVTVK